MEGPTGKKEEESKPIAVSIFDFDFGGHCPEAVLHQQVERFWATEKHGFVNTGECADSVEDREALKSLKRTTSLVNGKYEVGLLWKNENPHLPNNRALAEKKDFNSSRRSFNASLNLLNSTNQS